MTEQNRSVNNNNNNNNNVQQHCIYLHRESSYHSSWLFNINGSLINTTVIVSLLILIVS